MKSFTIGLLAAAGGVLLWAAQRSRRSSQVAATVPMVPEVSAAPSNRPRADIDPKMVITPRADIDPKMVITPRADIDPGIVVNPPPPRSPGDPARLRSAQEL